MDSDQDMRAALYLWMAMSRTLRSVEARLARQVEAHNLTLTEFGVLEALHHKGPLSLGEIGRAILLTSGSMTYVIGKLERRGLLVRTQGVTDRRVQHAELTADGRSLIEVVFPEHAALVHKLMGALTSQEQREAAAQLTRIRRSAEGTSPKSPPSP